MFRVSSIAVPPGMGGASLLLAISGSAKHLHTLKILEIPRPRIQDVSLLFLANVDS